MAATVACQRIVELCGICHRMWSKVAMATAACQGMMKLRGVRHRKWSRVVGGARLLGESGRNPLGADIGGGARLL